MIAVAACSMNVLVALFLGATVSSLSAATPAPPFNVTHYEAALNVDPDAGSIAGVVTLTIDVRQALDFIQLDAENLSIEKVELVGSGRSPARNLAFESSPLTLLIQSGLLLRPGLDRKIRIRYSARPKRGVRFTDGQVFTAFHTEAWMPCITAPDDKATLRLTLDFPEGMTVVANGNPEPLHSQASGRDVHVWNERRPYPAYLFGFAAGSLRCIHPDGQRPVLTFCAGSLQPAQLEKIFASVPRVIDFLEGRAGVPYPESRFAELLMKKGVAQEAAGYAILPESYAGDVLEEPREDWLIVHELAHAWWGNLITCRTWSDFWLNEGLVTFMTAAWKEREYGRDEYDRERFLARRRYDRATESRALRPLVYQGWKTSDEAGGPIPYYKGALVLHFLRHYLGEDAFWEALKTYTRTAAADDGLVTSEDLRRALSARSGADLSQIFGQWVYGEGVPKIVAFHELVGNEVIIHFSQKQPTIWTIPLQVAVETTEGRCVVDVTLRRAEERVHIPLSGALLSVRVDDGANLPEMIEHERSAEMLSWQAAHEPDAIGRAEAIVAFDALCRKSPDEPVCAAEVGFLAERRKIETSRLVRMVIEQALGQ